MYRTTSGTNPPAWTRALAPVGGALVIAIAVVALLGWITGEMWLASWSNGGTAFKFNTAIMTILAGLWLVVPVRHWRVGPSLAVGLPLLLASGAMTAEWIFSVSLGIDELLANDTSTTLPAGRVSWQFSTAFVVFALVILAGPIHRGRYWRRVPVALGMIFLFYALALETYVVFNADQLGSPGGMPKIAPASSLVVLGLSLGVIGRHSRRRPHRWLWETGIAGAFSRRMVPVSVLVPTVLGTVALVLIETETMPVRGALALLTSAIALTLLLVIADTIRFVTRAERDRDRVASELAAIFDSIPAVMAVRDLDGTLVRANTILTEVRGQGIGSIEGRRLAELYPPEIVEILEEQAEQIKVTGQAVTIDIATSPRPGVTRMTELTQFPVAAPDGKLLGLGAIGIDVTKRQEAQDAADRASERLKAYLDSAPDATIVVDADGVITYANEQTTRLVGYSQKELLGASVDLLVPSAVRIKHAGLRHRYARKPSRREMGADIALTARHRDGHEIPVEISLGPLETDLGAVTVASIRDVTDKRAAQQVLLSAEEHYRYLAEHDALTGLPNRRRFTTELESLMEATPVSGALLAIDLDHFKRVNDTLGHDAGDSLLVEVATALTSSVRSGDLLARIGGDEFLVLCPGCSAEDAAALAQRLVAVVDDVARRLGDAGAGVTASVGVVDLVDLEPGDRTPKVALLRADIALYGAKSDGRARSQVYIPASRDGEQAEDAPR